MRQVRPAFVAAASYQRTSYLPGELAQVDWWHSGVAVPVGKGATRQAFGLVASLPYSATLRVVFTLACGTAEFCAALVGCLQRLGGLPGGIVSDNDTAIVASRWGGTVRLVEEVAGVYGTLGLRAVVLRPRFPQGKGQVERAVGYLETSFLPLRSAGDLVDLQAQADAWTTQVADQRHVRRLGARVVDALVVERAALRRLPERWPDVDRRLEVRASRDGFVRVAGVDYSVPPRLAGRRLGVRLSLTEFTVACEAPRWPDMRAPGCRPTWCWPPITPASYAWPTRRSAAWQPTTCKSRSLTLAPTTNWSRCGHDRHRRAGPPDSGAEGAPHPPRRRPTGRTSPRRRLAV